MQFLHLAVQFSVPSTWMNAIKTGYYLTRPGLSAENIRKHLPKSPMTSRGHIEQKRKNMQSTKHVQTEDENIDAAPTQELDNIKT
eukprot:9107003-Ditylum_brightwellii.AAC.1